MFLTAYHTLNLSSAVLIGALGVVIAAVRIPARMHNRHYRTARTYLSLAFILLALLKVAELIVPKSTDDELTGCIALIVGAYQAFCFTTSLLLFIHPQQVTRSWVWAQLGVITAASTVLIACQQILPHAAYRVIFITFSVLYVCILAYYTWIFNKSYQRFKSDMDTYYQEEDLNRQLRWISHTFYSSLAVGCLVFLSLIGVRWLDCSFIVIYTVFYVYLTISFINYGQYVSTVMRAVMPEEEVKPMPDTSTAIDLANVNPVKPISETPEKYAAISAGLQKWVVERKYLIGNVGVKDIAQELNTSNRRLNEYFQEVVGEDFVKWRIRLRLHYACRLIYQQPDRSMQEVAAEAGFGDRSYFYRKFTEMMGMNVTEYKRQVILQQAQQMQDAAQKAMSEN